MNLPSNLPAPVAAFLTATFGLMQWLKSDVQFVPNNEDFANNISEAADILGNIYGPEVADLLDSVKYIIDKEGDNFTTWYDKLYNQLKNSEFNPSVMFQRVNSVS